LGAPLSAKEIRQLIRGLTTPLRQFYLADAMWQPQLAWEWRVVVRGCCEGWTVGAQNAVFRADFIAMQYFFLFRLCDALILIILNYLRNA